jgi:hypothetical protein
MAKWSQGIFKPKNPGKYIGTREPKYRSSWELSFFQFCDSNTHILQWASESIQIPYRNPVTGKPSIYVPDCFILYEDRRGVKHAELIEIKPMKEAVLTEKTKTRDKIVIAINTAKWQAATAWCQRSGITFRVLTERDMFHMGKKR